jgi:HPt (histidine-containing phosphotransfer) domain-containing protein
MHVTHREIIGGSELMPFMLEFPRVADTDSNAVDMAALAELEAAQVEGEPDLVVELIDLYLEDSSDKLVAICEAIDKTDEESLKHATHGLRGSSASLGAHRVAALCGELEQIGLSVSLDRVESLLIRLEQACELVRQVFSSERRRRLYAYSPMAT